MTTELNTPIEYSKEFVEYVNASPTPYHAVATTKKLLTAAGFVEILERDSWSIDSLDKPGKYFVTRNSSSIIAFTIGDAYKPGEGFAIVGAHTDSPCLRIKPVSNKTSEGFIQIGVEQYGGLIAHTWFDRDLAIAGRVYVKDSKTGGFVPRLIKIDKPLLRIPTLAIHLNREANIKFEFNKETKLVPIGGQVSSEDNLETEGCCNDPNLKLNDDEFNSIQSIISRHNRSLIDLIAKELAVDIHDIIDFELLLFDHQKPVIGGINDEFIFSPRLDNLTSCYCAAKGLVESVQNLSTQRGIRLISLFDHEEIGSQSAQGADSTFLPDILNRLCTPQTFYQSMSRSFLLSSDMSHGVHPNYGEFYEGKNRPEVNKGPVIKINANQRYATNSPGIVLMKKLGDTYHIPLQLFVVRNDSPCGSTIGPILASKLGIRTLDLGNPQLSMHSIRETGGSFDVIKLCKLFKGYFDDYHSLDDIILCDGV